MNNLIEKIVSGRYRVEEFLGKGGMAEVYKVWDQQRSVFLAMKILHADLAEDKIFLRRFRREAQTLAKLQHPNIVRFYGLEQSDGLVYILMEYVEGTTLRKEIFDSKKSLPAGRILEVVRPVCAALHYAHQSGFVHCDVKPANIMLGKSGAIYVSDFGIARMTEASTVTMVGAGTPAYMAPELVRGETPVPQTDIYSLGVMLFEMLTGGERPFTGEGAKTTGSTSEKILWEKMRLAAPPPSKFNSSIVPGLDAVVLKSLEKLPSSRYRSTPDLLDDLTKQILSMTQPVQQVPVHVPAEKQKPPRLITVPKEIEEQPTTIPSEQTKESLDKLEKSRRDALEKNKRRGLYISLGALAVALAGLCLVIGWANIDRSTPAISPSSNPVIRTSAPVIPLASPTKVATSVPTIISQSPTVVLPASTPKIQQYFTEEFDQGYENWSYFLNGGDENKFSLSNKDGGLFFDLTGQGIYAYLTYDLVEYQDVRIDASAQNIGVNTNNVTLFCRYSPEAGWYEFNVYNNGLYNIGFTEPNGNGNFTYSLITNGGSNEIKTGKATNEYSAICEGNTLTLYINGNLVKTIDVTRHILDSGKIGFSVSSLSLTPVQVSLDRIRVSSP